MLTKEDRPSVRIEASTRASNESNSHMFMGVNPGTNVHQSGGAGPAENLGDVPGAHAGPVVRSTSVEARVASTALDAGPTGARSASLARCAASR